VSINDEFGSTKSSVSEFGEEEATIKKTNPIKRGEQIEKVETNTKLEPRAPGNLRETTPLKTIGLFKIKTQLLKRKEEESRVAKEQPTTPRRSHFDKMYRYLRNAGATKEDATYGTRIAYETLMKSLGESAVEPEEKIITKECPEKSNQCYCNSENLLQNQQQQIISLLAQVPAFNGMRSTKYGLDSAF
jgi:hypothetical protein